MFEKFFKSFQPKQEPSVDLAKLFRAAAEGEQIAALQRAISTIKEKPDEISSDDFAGWASFVLTDEVRRKLGMNIRDDDDLYCLGIAAFVFSNHFSSIMQTNFEMATFLALIKLTKSPDELIRSHPAIANSYNKMTVENSKAIKILGQRCASWVQNPGPNTLDDIVSLLKIFREHTSETG